MASKKDTREEAAVKAVGLPEVGQAELDKAKKEGIKEGAKEAAKDAFAYATDGPPLAPAEGPRYVGSSDIMQFAPLLDQGVEEFAATVAEDADNPVPEEKVAGLLKLERAGLNRTPYVKALMDRLGIKSPYEVTDAGPDYTNDMTPITKL